MKMRFLWLGLCLPLLLLTGACSKSTDIDKIPPMQIEGVNVDLGKLSTEFSAVSPTAPDLQSKINAAVLKVRYKQYVPAMMALDEVLNSPGLTDKQKKLVTDVIAQLKEVAAKNPGNQ